MVNERHAAGGRFLSVFPSMGVGLRSLLRNTGRLCSVTFCRRIASFFPQFLFCVNNLFLKFWIDPCVTARIEPFGSQEGILFHEMFRGSFSFSPPSLERAGEFSPLPTWTGHGRPGHDVRGVRILFHKPPLFPQYFLLALVL